MKKLLRKIGRPFAVAGGWVYRAIDTQDILIFAGGACLIAGAHQIYRPAGFLVAGALCLWAVYLIERAKRIDRKENKRGPS